MRKLLMLGSLVALLVPAASQAQVSLGLRAGYAPAMGDAAKDVKMKDFSNKSQIPLQLDAMYKINPDLAVGAYFSYGFGQVDYPVCAVDGVDCSGNVMRFGVQGHYTFNQVKSPLVPWAGVGFGYEIAKDEFKLAGASTKTTLRGFELLNLQVGGDYKVSEQFAVGPYLQFSLGQYSDVKITDSTDPSENVDGSIPSKGLHEWFGFGIRGKFDL